MLYSHAETLRWASWRGGCQCSDDDGHAPAGVQQACHGATDQP